jgi:hypothetical protein
MFIYKNLCDFGLVHCNVLKKRTNKIFKLFYTTTSPFITMHLFPWSYVLARFVTKYFSQFVSYFNGCTYYITIFTAQLPLISLRHGMASDAYIAVVGIVWVVQFVKWTYQ